jgi:hypothetical protein
VPRALPGARQEDSAGGSATGASAEGSANDSVPPFKEDTWGEPPPQSKQGSDEAPGEGFLSPAMRVVG